MNDHKPASPMLDDDELTVQQHLVERVSFLLNVNADLELWRLEASTLRSASGDQWQRSNAFLLDFTLARFLVAIRSGGDGIAAASSGAPGAAEQSVRRFLGAVDQQRGIDAQDIWYEANAGNMAPRESDISPTTLALVWRLVRGAAAAERIPTTEALPEPFERPQFVS